MTGPPIVERPVDSDAHGARRQMPVSRLVVHSMSEYITTEEGCFYAPDFLYTVFKYSAHYFVTPSGRLIRTVDDDVIAYHARGYNSDSLGCEFLVKGEHDWASFKTAIADEENSPYTEDQYRAGAWLYRKWMRENQLGLDKIQRHSDLSPDRKVDPGPAFEMARLNWWIEQWTRSERDRQPT